MKIDPAIKTNSLLRSSAFTLLEVLIALALVAILMVAAAPYMRDALNRNQGDQIEESLEILVEKTRATALDSGNSQQIDLSQTDLIPKGWKLEIERMSDNKFHPPAPGEIWNINNEGICDPMTLRLLQNKTSITLKFDPITGQVLHDE